MSSGALTRMGSVLKLTLRLDRVWLPGWALACVVFIVCFIPLLPALVDSEEMLTILKETMSSPAVVALCGMIYGEEYTFGVMYTQMMFVWSALVVVLMNIFLVDRHTRKDEESGRLELISALPVGRAAPLASLALIVVAVNVIVALLISVCMVSFNLESIDLAGSLVYGAGVGGIGLIFGALTMLFAQITSTSKSTLGFSFAVLGISYLLRAVGDMGADPATSPLGFISPFGLGERTYPFYENLWWPIAVMVGVAIVLATLAFMLNVRRNQGSGLLPARRGKAHARRLLTNQFALSFRLMRSTIIAWAVILFFLALSYGSVFNDLASFYEESPLIQAFFGASGAEENLLEISIGTLIAMMSIISVAPVVIIVNHLRVEERSKRLELVYSTASSKLFSLLGYAGIAAIVALLFQLLTAFGMWAGAAATMSDPIAMDVFLKAALNILPPILVFEGLAVLLIGCAPRLIPLVWGYLAYAFYVEYLGGAFDLPEAFVKLSPFGIVSRYPSEAFDPVPFVALLAVFVAMSAAGLAFYRARDMKT